MKFSLTILGCNSAIPAHGRFPSSQVLNIRGNLLLIDCGEGTQMRMAEFQVKRSRIEQIFISHLHGDHIFGLAGLLTSYSLLKRTTPLTVFAPAGLEEIIDLQFRLSQTVPTYPLHFHTIDTEKHQRILDHPDFRVYTIPLKHRIPTAGFLFREKEQERSMIPEMIGKYNIPFQRIPALKKGEDLELPDGRVIPNETLTNPPPRPRSYAYCSDTAYTDSILPIIRGVDLLYHETTFDASMEEYARITLHSTTTQAARVADQAGVGKLITGHYSTRYKDLHPLLEEARSVFPATELGYDGAVFELAPHDPSRVDQV